MTIELIVHYDTSAGIVHFDTGAEGDYLAHVTFFARAKRVRKVIDIEEDYATL